MRIPTVQHDDEASRSMSMTPMIDVVFLLLIFFVCASVGQIRESLLPTELSPGSIESPELMEVEKPLGEVWLKLTRTDDERTLVELNDREYDDFGQLETTLKQLAELAPEIPIILDIAPAVPMRDMIRVYDTCRAADFETIQFAIERSERQTPKQGPHVEVKSVNQS